MRRNSGGHLHLHVGDDKGEPMTATERLRELLDERGVEHEGGERSVRWRDRNGVMMQAFPLADGELGMAVWSCTPEQAIAATLGDTDATAERHGDASCSCSNSERTRTCKAKLYKPEYGFSDCTICECGEINDISAIYCNRCGRRIEVVAE